MMMVMNLCPGWVDISCASRGLRIGFIICNCQPGGDFVKKIFKMVMMSIRDNDKSSEVGLQGRCEDDGEHPGDETDLEEVFFQRLIFR